MKIILSRKGFDSKYGGMPSPIILSENRFYPLPIPYKNSNIRFSDVKFEQGISARKILNDLGYNQIEKNCHLDPDLFFGSIKRNQMWKPALGQAGASQGHLKNNFITIGDIFLFYGWFQFAEFTKIGNLKYLKNELFPKGFHAIYGYLQIGEMIEVDDNTKRIKYIANHPHVLHHNFFKKGSNMIYVAKKKLNSFGANIKGAGVFQFDESFILTRKIIDKPNCNRSNWEFPNSFHPESGVLLTYNKNIAKWNTKNSKRTTMLDAAKIGQEFIFIKDPDKNVLKWVERLFKKNNV